MTKKHIEKEKIFKDFEIFKEKLKNRIYEHTLSASTSKSKERKYKSHPNLQQNNIYSNIIPVRTNQISIKKPIYTNYTNFDKFKTEFKAELKNKNQRKLLNNSNSSNSIFNKKSPILNPNSAKSYKSKCRERAFSKISTQHDSNKNLFKDISPLKKNYYLSEKNNESRNKTKKLNNIFNVPLTFDKYYEHLLEKMTFLNYQVKEFKLEKEKLNKTLLESNTEHSTQITKLENEIKSYKKMTESCVKTCSQLAEEIILLKKEISKYTIGNNDKNITSLFFGKLNNK